MRQPKVTYFDLDGTLLDQDSRLRPEVLGVLSELKHLGIALGVATGRLLESARPYLDAIGCTAPIILLNGLELVAPQDGPPLFLAHLSADVAAHVLRRANQAQVHVNLYWEDQYFMDSDDPFGKAFIDKERFMPTMVEDLSSLLHRDPVKLLLIGPPERLASLREQCLEELDGAVQLVFSEPDFLEVLPPGITKGTALERSAEILGVETQDVAAFGDGPNDADMLRRAGLGIAVGNARGEARLAADWITDAPGFAGVLEALEQIFGLLHREYKL